MSKHDNVLRHSLEEATTQYQGKRETVVTYLAARGLPESTADAFRLGYVQSPVTGHEQYQGRLAIPYLTRGGVVALRFRCLRKHDCKQSGCPKYLSMDNARPHLYNVADLFSPIPYIGIAEGELDAIALHSAGIPAVGVAGVSMWRSHFTRLFTGYTQVLVFADGDDAGKGLAKNLTQVLDNARIVHLPEGVDVNDVYQTEGPQALRERAGL